MDIPQVFFSNLQLLGFDAFAMERKWRIPFNKEMFHLPNKKGFEAVMYFLFEKLNPIQCREQFRDCWPVSDKKEEQSFRKVVNTWLNEIAKEPDIHFPRVLGSVLLSPGGDKFYQLVFAFSAYVLFKSIIHENGYKQRNFLRHPILTSQNQIMSPVMLQAILCSSIKHRKEFLAHVQLAAAVQDQWKQFASELVKTYRSVSKTIRDLERDLKLEAQKSLEINTSLGSSRRNTGLNEYDSEVQSVRRGQRVQEVRDLWKQVDKFCLGKVKERDVVETVLHGTMDKYKINASDLNVKVPDLLLRECEKEIQRRGVENIYEGGKLNLLSVIHLWNLSLHLYIERLHQCGISDFDESVAVINTQVHTHHAHLSNVQSLRMQLEKETIPGLKRSISRLKKDLDNQVFASYSPNSMKTTVLGFGLIPPTPPVSFDPSETKTPSYMAINMEKSTSVNVNTPEAAMQLMDSINNRVKMSQPSSPLVQGTPLYAPRQDLVSRQRVGHGTEYTSPLGEGAEVETRGQRQSFRPRSHAESHKLHSKSHKPVSATTKTKLPSTSRVPKAQMGVSVSRGSNKKGAVVKETVSGTRLVQHETEVEAEAKENLSAQVVFTANDVKSKGDISPTSFRIQMSSPQALRRAIEMNELDASALSSIPRSPPSSDILADRLVDELMSSDTREVLGQAGDEEENFNKLHNVSPNPRMANSQAPARTPTRSSQPTWHEALLENSYGPLSSTRIETKPILERGNRDKVTANLFDDNHASQNDNNVVNINRNRNGKLEHKIDNLVNSGSRQETYGAELIEETAGRSNSGNSQAAGSYARESNRTCNNSQAKSLRIRLSDDYTDKDSQCSEGKVPAHDIGAKYAMRNKRVELDPYGESTLKFSLSPDVSGVGLLSGIAEQTKTLDFVDIQQKLSFVTDGSVTESYKCLSETNTPVLPTRSKSQIPGLDHRMVNLNTTAGLDQSKGSKLSELGQSSLFKESYKTLQSAQQSKSSDELGVTFDTPSEIDPTLSIDNIGGSRAVDLLKMTPGKAGIHDYSLGIFDLNLSEAFPGQLSSVSPNSPRVTSDKSGSPIVTMVETEEQSTDNHVKWKDLEQEIRNADTNLNDASQLTSLASDIVIEESVRVIEFQNGSFNEFLEKSPLNQKQKQKSNVVSIDDSSTSESSDLSYSAKKMNSSSVRSSNQGQSNSNSATDDLIARYKKLRANTDNPPGNHSSVIHNPVHKVVESEEKLIDLGYDNDVDSNIPCQSDHRNSPSLNKYLSKMKTDSFNHTLPGVSPQQDKSPHIPKQHQHDQRKTNLKFSLDFDFVNPTSPDNKEGSEGGWSSMDAILNSGLKDYTTGSGNNFVATTGGDLFNYSPSSRVNTSALTGMIHMDDVFLSRNVRSGNDRRISDLFGEDESMLVPPSPP